MNKLILASVLCLSFTAFNQDREAIKKDKAEVEKVINKLFKGMHDSDSSMVRHCFYSTCTMKTTYFKEGKSKIGNGSLDEFLEAIGTPKEQVWDERISNLEISIDDNLAVGWMNYSFFLNEKLNHCGVNSIQLFKSHEGWKITDITDTHRNDNCE